MKKSNRAAAAKVAESRPEIVVETTHDPLYDAKTTKMTISPVFGDQLMTSLEDIMTAEVIAVEKGIPITYAAQLMRDNDVGILPVVDGERHVVGCVTDRDLAVRALTPNIANPQGLVVADVMSESAWCASLDNTVEEVVAAMGTHKVRRMPVLNSDKQLVGIVSIGDVAVKADRDEALTAALEKISSHENFWHNNWR